MPHDLPNTKLYYREGGSDKEYHAAVIAQGDAGYLVNFAFGRRGSTLRPGTKTQAPVPLEQATAIYQKLIDGKMREGYTPDGTGQVFVGGDLEERKSGYLPQLLNPISYDELEAYLADDTFLLQEKLDGERRLLLRDADGAKGINRKGLFVPLIQPLHDEVCAVLDAGTILDGELVGETYYVFDLLQRGETDLRNEPVHSRLKQITDLMTEAERRHGQPFVHLKLVVTGEDAATKRALLEAVRSRGGEGVVFKRRDAAYKAGRPASRGNHVKFKLWESATCFVTAVNAQRSVAVAVLDGESVVGVGNVSVPVSHAVPTVGTIAEIKYLYAYPGGSLYQPQYRGARTDLDREECTLSQLKYKA
jgi:bifunctional non-homologous end joining protein LigD